MVDVPVASDAVNIPWLSPMDDIIEVSSNLNPPDYMLPVEEK
jgi:hypothetical protein